MSEEWVPIVGWEDRYEVSSLGRVRSLYTAKGKRKIPKILKQMVTTSGYYYVMLSNNDFRKNKTLHRLYAEAFIHNPKKLPCINHKNGIKLDNRRENLEWCTHIYNDRHARRTGLINQKGERSACAKLTNTAVKRIRSVYKPRKYTRNKLAKEYSVSVPTIDAVLYRISWKHL